LRIVVHTGQSRRGLLLAWSPTFLKWSGAVVSHSVRFDRTPGRSTLRPFKGEVLVK
jgi:hypothetical protein